MAGRKSGKSSMRHTWEQIIVITPEEVLKYPLLNRVTPAKQREYVAMTKTHTSVTITSETHYKMTGIYKTDGEEIIDWIRTNIQNDVWYCQLKMWFKTPEEALQFKMRWV